MESAENKKTIRLGILAAIVYIGFLVAAIAAFRIIDDDSTFFAVICTISSALSLVTILIAIAILRSKSSPSERYKEMFGEETEDGHRRSVISSSLSSISR